MNFQTEFRRIRKLKKLTQEQAAELLEVSSRAIKAWEGGEYLPKHETLILEKIKIANIKDYEGLLVAEIYKTNGFESLYWNQKWILKLKTDGKTIEKTLTFTEAMDWLEENGKAKAIFDYVTEKTLKKSEVTAL